MMAGISLICMKNRILTLCVKMIIKNFGPIKSASLDFKRVNVLIGPQSSGKSTILKIASFCNWVEKKIQLTQVPGDWMNPDVVRDQLITFHKLDDYALPGAEIYYKSDTLQFEIKFDKKPRGILSRQSRIGSM